MDRTRRACREGAASPKAGWEIRESSQCPLLSRCPHHAPLCLPTMGLAFHPNFGCPPQAPPARHSCLCPRVKGPHQSQPMSSLVSPSQNSLPSHSPVTLILDPLSPSAGSSFQVPLPEMHPLRLPSLRVSCFIPRMMEARGEPQSPGQVEGQSGTLCWALNPISAPRPSP